MVDPDAGASDSRLHELHLARLLGEYLDRSVAGAPVDRDRLLLDHVDIRADIKEEVAMLEQVASLVDRNFSDDFADFRVLREVGRGDLGIVYDAVQVSRRRRVALKVLSAGLVPDSEGVARFRREAQVAVTLDHPNIVPVYSIGVSGGMPHLAMDFIRGQTLSQIIRSSRTRTDSGRIDTSRWTHSPLGRLLGSSDQPSESGVGTRSLPGQILTGSEEVDRHYYLRLAEAFAGVADALEYAHRARVCHHDLKPSNLILDSSGRMLVLDFGLAWIRQLDETDSGRPPWLRRERSGALPYVGPEQIQDRYGPTGPALDIYGLGATLYELLVWRPPFEGNSQDILHRILHRDPVPPRRMNLRIPHQLERIVLRCLRKAPRERYRSAEELAEELRRLSGARSP